MPGLQTYGINVVWPSLLFVWNFGMNLRSKNLLNFIFFKFRFSGQLTVAELQLTPGRKFVETLLSSPCV